MNKLHSARIKGHGSKLEATVARRPDPTTGLVMLEELGPAAERAVGLNSQ